jgi:hypothetical protein
MYLIRRTLEIEFFFNAIKESVVSKKKIWVDAGLIGMTIDLPNEELREINKDMRKIPKSPKVTRKNK